MDRRNFLSKSGLSVLASALPLPAMIRLQALMSGKPPDVEYQSQRDANLLVGMAIRPHPTAEDWGRLLAWVHPGGWLVEPWGVSGSRTAATVAEVVLGLRGALLGHLRPIVAVCSQWTGPRQVQPHGQGVFRKRQLSQDTAEIETDDDVRPAGFRLVHGPWKTHPAELTDERYAENWLSAWIALDPSATGDRHLGRRITITHYTAEKESHA